MTKMIFVNLPVRDLPASMRFYEAVGFTNNPQFTNEQAAAMVWSDTIYVMLLTHAFWKTFTAKTIPNSNEVAQVLLCLSQDSREAVEAIVAKSVAAGGTADPTPVQDMSFMYGRSFEDPGRPHLGKRLHGHGGDASAARSERGLSRTDGADNGDPPLPASGGAGPGVWTGRILSGLVTVFLVLDAGIKIAGIQAVAETAVPLGWTGDFGFWRAMGVLLLALTALYAWPRTAVLGAVLLTGYLGGAIATHLRVGSPLLSHTLFGLYLGLAMWAGLWLRSPAVRDLLPVSARS